MEKLTYKSLFTLVDELIAKRVKFNTTAKYEGQTSRDSIKPITQDSASSIDSGRLISDIQDILEDVLEDRIISGLSVTATSPPSAKVNISSGTGTSGGLVYELGSDVEIEIPFDDVTSVYFVNLYKNRILIDKNERSDKLTIAKIIVPKPGTTNTITDDRGEEDDWDAYIVNFKKYNLYGDANDKFEEDTIDLLRNNISPILADNLIGNIKLSEDLKVINNAGTLELNSDSLKLYDLDENNLAKFNRKGVYFYDTDGIERARFTSDDARVGNILVTKNSIESGNFVTGSTGFQIKDDGTVEFSDGTFRGTLSAVTGEIGGFTIESDKLYGGSIQTAESVGVGNTGVIMDTDGLRGYDSVLGEVFNIPTDGTAPSFSSGTISETTFEINTNAVLRTASTVGDGSASSAGILINNTGLYGCESNQTLADANLKALVDGTVKLSGEISATSGQIGGVTISGNDLSGGNILGIVLIGGSFQTDSNPPRVIINEDGLGYERTSNVGTYGSDESGSTGFLYGDGTLYGAGVDGYIFNNEYPAIAILAEDTDHADLRLYNREADPIDGTHEVGDLIVVDGKLKICTSAGSPGTFTVVGTQS